MTVKLVVVIAENDMAVPGVGPPGVCPAVIGEVSAGVLFLLQKVIKKTSDHSSAAVKYFGGMILVSERGEWLCWDSFDRTANEFDFRGPS